jgi:4-hydroxy-2-oxoheptanedioate aldolase
VKTPANDFKAGLAAGSQQIGIRSMACSAMVAEILGNSGYDFVYIDMEHAPQDPMGMYHQLQALGCAGTPAMIKLAINDPVAVQRLLDMGAINYVVPMIQNAKQAKEAVKLAKYPPLGTRGAPGIIRASRYGLYDDYFKRADDEICMIMQIETVEALSNIESISDVDGVDGILFGPGDIAADLGHLGTSGHPDVIERVSAAMKKLRTKKVPFGMSAVETDAEHWLSLGCNFVTIANDMALLAKHARALSAKFSKSNKS